MQATYSFSQCTICTVVVALEPPAYSEGIGHTIQEMRTSLSIEVVDPETLHQEVVRLNAHLVLCSQPKPTMLNGPYAWIEYRPYEEPTALRINGQWREVGRIIELNDLLEIIDELCRRALS